MFKKIIIVALIVLICLSAIAAIKEYKRSTNLRVKGWLFGDTSWCGIREWNTTGTADTIAIAGLDTTCMFFATIRDTTKRWPLCANISRNGDTVFVNVDSSYFSGLKYSWMVVRP